MIKPIQASIPPIVTIMLKTNAKVLIDRAPSTSFFRLLLRQIIENIRGIKPIKPQPINKLIIDHGNQSRILRATGAGIN